MRLPGAHRGVSGWALAAALLVAGFLAAGILAELFGSEPQGPPSSSYATDSQGLAAWASLLQRHGHPVVRLGVISRYSDAPQRTVP